MKQPAEPTALLQISGLLRKFSAAPERIERQWFEQVYRGRGDRLPQLTCRAVITGSIVGGLLSVTNVYIGPRTGWSFGVPITALIFSYAVWTNSYRVGMVRGRLGILENNWL